MNIKIIQDSQNELIQPEVAKNYLRLDHDFDDDLIKIMITATRELIENYIKKAITQKNIEYILENESDKNINFTNNGFFITLPLQPVIEIEEISINNEIIAKNQYKLINYQNSTILSFDSSFCSQIKIKYLAGISKDIEKIPFQLRLANLIALANAYNNRFLPQNLKKEILSSDVCSILTTFKTLKIF